MPEFVTIDGAEGEGGGQIVRSSAALSIITGAPLRLINIRHRRKPAGLRKQHLTALRAAAEICNGDLTGAEVGAREIQFIPGKVQPGPYHFAVGTAGSATLVLQTVLPALITADEPSTLCVEGGTHNPWAPPYEYLAAVYAPLIERMGPRLKLSLQQYGFYPAGGGKILVEVTPSPVLHGFDLIDRGRLQRTEVSAVVANLPEHIADREVSTVMRKFGWKVSRRNPERVVRTETVAALSPGNVLTVDLQWEHARELVTAFGRQGIRAEHVAREAVTEVSPLLDSPVPVGVHTADQLLLPLGLSAAQAGDHRRGGSFRTGPLSDHSLTHIEILKTFLGVKVAVQNKTIESAAGQNRDVIDVEVTG